MEGFAVTCPLAPGASRLISGFCSSSRSFGLDFLQTPPRDDALALLLAFGSAKTWQPDFHRLSNAPCPAHTSKCSAAPAWRPLQLKLERCGQSIANLKERLHAPSERHIVVRHIAISAVLFSRKINVFHTVSITFSASRRSTRVGTI